jgi:hypothetical protein
LILVGETHIAAPSVVLALTLSTETTTAKDFAKPAFTKDTSTAKIAVKYFAKTSSMFTTSQYTAIRASTRLPHFARCVEKQPTMMTYMRHRQANDVKPALIGTSSNAHSVVNMNTQT